MNKIVLVTDYDDTLSNGKKYIEKNKKAIKKFRKKGNIFVIATGRSYKSVCKVIEKDFKNLGYDYLITNHGASIFDSSGIIINSKNIKAKTLDKILNIVNKTKIKKIYKYTEESDEIEKSNMYNKIMFEYKETTASLKDLEAIRKLKIVKAYPIMRKGKTPKIEIINKNADKRKAIKYIQTLEIPNKIHVIGDAYQDFEMIKDYDGYCVKNAIEEIKRISKKEYIAVYELINDILD